MTDLLLLFVGVLIGIICTGTVYEMRVMTIRAEMQAMIIDIRAMITKLYLEKRAHQDNSQEILNEWNNAKGKK